MNEIEFQKYKTKIQNILSFVLENPRSDFYRKKYEGVAIDPKNIDSYADFCRIPLLTKDELLSLPISKRSFLGKNEIIRYGVSSGTTSQNRPLILPHLTINGQEGTTGSYDEPFVKGLGVTIILGLLPVNSMIQKIQLSQKMSIPIIQLELNKMVLAVITAQESGAEGIISSPTILYIFTEELKKTNFDRNMIKWISIGSELCTTQKLAYFKSNYPKAYIEIRYGNSEAGTNIGYRCEELSKHGNNPQLFHPNDINFIEVIPETVSNDKSGEVIFTHLYKEGFPLIRYQTGDFATEQYTDCKCGQNRLIDTHGKNNYDVLKTSGVVIHSQAITNALETISESVESDFQMHVYEESYKNKIKTKLILHLVPKNDNLSEKQVASIVENNLQVSLNKTLGDLINKDLFFPLEVKFVENFSTNHKTKSIVSHLAS